MLKFNLSEMKNESGSSLRYDAEAIARKLAILLSAEIERSKNFRRLYRIMPSPRLILYFQHLIKKEVLPVVCEAVAIEWCRRNGKVIPSDEQRLIVPHGGIFPAIKRYWTMGEPLRIVSPFRFYLKRRDLAKSEVSKVIKSRLKAIADAFEQFHPRRKPQIAVSPNGMIACHFAEGLEVGRRNDLSWFWESGIDPERILIYFDTLYYRNGRPVPRAITDWIEQNGFSWVMLKKGVIEDGDDHYWYPTAPPQPISYDRSSLLEGWIADQAHELTNAVHYWKSFYDEFNVRIQYIPEEGVATNIVQSIAFDLATQRAGFLVGKQQSDMFSLHSDDVGFHPKNVFFVWSKRTPAHLRHNRDCVEQFVISGYPYVCARQDGKKSFTYVESVKKHGAEFVVVLFDNMHSNTVHSNIRNNVRAYSSVMMTAFFERFLNLVIKDPAFGLVIKSKKPIVIEHLPSIHGLLECALATKRCVSVDDIWSRLSSSVSLGADVAVGIGIASSIIEVATAGLRGVLYDAQTIRSHEYYAWSDCRVIFEDLDELIDLLLRYKADPKKVPGFGDWSSHIDEIDHFHDNHGSARMGQYMRLLLEGLSESNDRKNALRYAREEYSKQWGSETVVEIPFRDSPAYTGV